MGKVTSGKVMGLGLQEAPVFYPNDAEFENPMKYISSIRQRAEQYGMCRIVPPISWKPPFALDHDKFHFTTKVQAIHRLQERPPGCDPDTFKLEYRRFCDREGLPLARWPQFEGAELDLCKLYNAVRRRGGYQKVLAQKQWQEVMKMTIPDSGAGFLCESTDALTTLQQLYVQYLLLYEVYQANPGAPLIIPAEIRAKLGMEHTMFSATVKEEVKKDQKAGGAQQVAPIGEEGKVERVETREKTRKHTRSDSAIISTDVAAALAAALCGAAAAVAGVGAGAAAEGMGDVPSAKRVKLEDGSEPEKRGVDAGSIVEGGAEEKMKRNAGSTSKREQKCKQCQGESHEDAMLFCDKCDRGWHLYCLSPPLTAVPKGSWYCFDCLTSEKECFGFCTGEEHSLGSFQRMAERFKKRWFGSETRVRGLSPAETETEFWRIVERSTQPVEVLYGSDLDTSQCGSGFPRKSDTCPPGKNREQWQKYARSPWNLNNMPKSDGSVLRHIDDNIPGVIVPWLYVGMAFSSFCWHYEDHCFYSINYLHWGEPKQWYGVPGIAAELFEGVMKQAFPDLFEAQPDLLFQLVTMLNPTVLKEAGVPVYSCLQEERQFVVTFPRSYHGGFNHGFNCAEAVNFAPADWFPWGGCGVERYRLFRRSAILSHEELLCVVAKSGQRDPEMLQWLWKELERVTLAERTNLLALWAAGTVRSARMSPRKTPDRISQDEDPECIICRYYLHLSAVVCSCRPQDAVCLGHARQLCACPPSKRRILYRYSLAELEGFLKASEPPCPLADEKCPQNGTAAAALAMSGTLKRTRQRQQQLQQLQQLHLQQQKQLSQQQSSQISGGVVAVAVCSAGKNGSEAALAFKRLVNGRQVSHGEAACEWAARTTEVLRVAPSLATVEQILEEAEEFLWGGEEVAPVRDIEDKMRAAKTWADDILACCRVAGAAPMTTLAATSAYVLPPGGSGLIGAPAGPRDPRGRGTPLAKVEELMKEEPLLCLNSQLRELKELHAKALILQKRLEDAMTAEPPSEFQALLALYQEALRAPIEVPQMKQAKDLLAAAQAWVDAVRRALPCTKVFRRRPQCDLPSFDQLVSLHAQGEKLRVRLGEHATLQGALDIAKAWQEKAQRLAAGQPSLQAGVELLEEAASVPACVPECAHLRQRVERAQNWAQRAKAAVFAPLRSGPASTQAQQQWHAATTEALERLIQEGTGELHFEMREEIHWLESEVKTRRWRKAAIQAMDGKADAPTLRALAEEAARLGLGVGEPMAIRIRHLSEAASLWEKQAEKAFSSGGSLEEFASLARSGETLNTKLSRREEVVEALARARTWLERAQPLLRGKPRGRHRVAFDPVPLETLQHLAADIPLLRVTLKEVDHIRSRLQETDQWQTKARDLLATPLFPTLCRIPSGHPCPLCAAQGLYGHRLVDGGLEGASGSSRTTRSSGGGGGLKADMELGAVGARRTAILEALWDDGVALGIDVPEVEKLKTAVKDVEWQVNAQKVLETKGSLHALEEVEAHAARLAAAGVEVDSEKRAFVQTALVQGKAWLARAAVLTEGGQACTPSGESECLREDPATSAQGWTEAEMEGLLAEAQVLPVQLASVELALQEKLHAHREWLIEARKVLPHDDAAQHMRTLEDHRWLLPNVSIAELQSLVERGRSTGARCRELGVLEPALHALGQWTQHCWTAVMGSLPWDDTSSAEIAFSDRLEQIELSLQRAMTVVGREGPVPLPSPDSPSPPLSCACLRAPDSPGLAGEQPSSPPLICESCRDSFHPGCLPGVSEALSPDAEQHFTCPFCMALADGILPSMSTSRAAAASIEGDGIDAREAERIRLASLQRVNEEASTLTCRSEEVERVNRIVELAAEWGARMKEVLEVAIELPRRSSPLAAPALVRIMKAAGVIEVVDEEAQDQLERAVAAQAWRVRACRLMISKPSFESLASVLKEGLQGPVGRDDRVLQELKQRKALVQAWAVEAKAVAYDDGAAPLERVLALIAAGAALPLSLDRELEILRERCNLYCSCNRPRIALPDRGRKLFLPMLTCVRCHQMYHYACLGLPPPSSSSDSDSEDENVQDVEEEEEERGGSVLGASARIGQRDSYASSRRSRGSGELWAAANESEGGGERRAGKEEVLVKGVGEGGCMAQLHTQEEGYSLGRQYEKGGHSEYAETERDGNGEAAANNVCGLDGTEGREGRVERDASVGGLGQERTSPENTVEFEMRETGMGCSTSSDCEVATAAHQGVILPGDSHLKRTETDVEEVQEGREGVPFECHPGLYAHGAHASAGCLPLENSSRHHEFDGTSFPLVPSHEDEDDKHDEDTDATASTRSGDDSFLCSSCVDMALEQERVHAAALRQRTEALQLRALVLMERQRAREQQQNQQQEHQQHQQGMLITPQHRCSVGGSLGTEEGSSEAEARASDEGRENAEAADGEGRSPSYSDLPRRVSGVADVPEEGGGEGADRDRMPRSQHSSPSRYQASPKAPHPFPSQEVLLAPSPTHPCISPPTAPPSPPLIVPIVRGKRSVRLPGERQQVQNQLTTLPLALPLHAAGPRDLPTRSIQGLQGSKGPQGSRPQAHLAREKSSQLISMLLASSNRAETPREQAGAFICKGEAKESGDNAAFGRQQKEESEQEEYGQETKQQRNRHEEHHGSRHSVHEEHAVYGHRGSLSVPPPQTNRTSDRKVSHRKRAIAVSTSSDEEFGGRRLVGVPTPPSSGATKRPCRKTAGKHRGFEGFVVMMR
eukprot:TRINITY_DN4596_c1_g1_i1.p1 TRINITY_DN4596_c1_g1~~TRINITY_DN4596_c1_g1_i1.p1  ORF type:complete len:2735 (-),score=484.18 TRINITY_DN4596_c1_g1_i1:871-9075(-)